MGEGFNILTPMKDNHLYIVKVFFVILSLFLAATATTRANDYLEVQSHYSLYSVGPEAIHVKVPLWAYGRVNNYYIANGSYLYFKYKGSQDK